MFKFLKNKQNIKSGLLYSILFSVVLLIILFLFYDSSEEFGQLERLERLDQEVASLAESVIRTGQLVEETRETLHKRVLTLLELNELLQTNLEQKNEILMLLERRISPLQGMLNNADLNSTDLTAVQAEIADILQTLKSINETETAEPTESKSEQSNSIETE